MTFGRPFTSSGAGGSVVSAARAGGGVAALCIFAVASVVALFGVVLALGVMPAEARREREIPLELVSVSKGTTPPHISAHEVVVHVGKSGRIRVGGSDLQVEALNDRLRRLTAGARDTAITVRADARAPYELIAKVLGAARRAGIRRASLLTVEETPRGGQPPPRGEAESGRGRALRTRVAPRPRRRGRRRSRGRLTPGPRRALCPRSGAGDGGRFGRRT